jgi:hypothetical protein
MDKIVFTPTQSLHMLGQNPISMILLSEIHIFHKYSFESFKISPENLEIIPKFPISLIEHSIIPSVCGILSLESVA